MVGDRHGCSGGIILTCIVALEHDGKVYLGGDSAAVSDWNIEVCAQPKVFRVGDFIMGYTSSFRMGQLLQYELVIPENTEDSDIRYLVTRFIPAVRDCLKNGGYTKIDNNREEAGSFLIGYRGKAYKISSDFQVTRMSAGFTAVGCGQDFAIGAMEILDKTNPEEAVTLSLKAAGKFSNGVCPPYTVISL